jgi:proline dehydrogenase
VFEQFCSGETLEESFNTVKRLQNKNVKSYLHYSVEGLENEDSYDLSLNEVLDSIKFVAEKQILDFTVFKPTAIANSLILEKKSKGDSLNDNEQAIYKRAYQRFNKICEFAYNKDVKILVDAEESWIQDAIDHIVLEMMIKFNKDKAVVFNTSQMYRHDRLEYLQSLHEAAIERKFHIGIKLVRGAYIEKENKRAKKNNYLSPICNSKDLTDQNFDNGASYILSNLDLFSLFSGTHNEESIYKIIEIMNSKKINKDDSSIWFGQLYGMSDNITFNLASEGFNVIKYLPYGPIKEVIPYLIRRAEENTSVKGQTSRELELIKKELKRRDSI